MENREELNRFQADMTTDRELYRKLEEIGRRMLKDGSKESSSELMAKAAKELGYSVTAAELERMEAEAEGLDDDQLEAVSGGSTAAENLIPTSCKINFTCGQSICTPDSDGIYRQCRRYPYEAASDPNLQN